MIDKSPLKSPCRPLSECPLGIIANRIRIIPKVRATSSLPPPAEAESILRPVSKKNDKEQQIGRAMRAYLERAAKHEKFMAEKHDEFQLGKRHLANIMGWNPEEISQQDIDVSN